MERLPTEVLRVHKGVSFVGVTTCFFCYDNKGRFLLSKRSKKARDEQGRWEIGGGGLKWGLSPEQNIKRELKEEYNADALNIEFLGHRNIFRELDDGTKTHWVGLDFAVLINPGQVNINEPEMIDDIGWYTRKNLPRPLHSQQKPFFNQYKRALDKLGII